MSPPLLLCCPDTVDSNTRGDDFLDQAEELGGELKAEGVWLVGFGDEVDGIIALGEEVLELVNRFVSIV